MSSPAGGSAIGVKYRVGQGFDFHPLVEGRKLILGGVEIAHAKGLKGHSDADVAAHALANAILGAIGQGDLGRHFADSDPKHAGADSIRLLAEVWTTAAAAGWRLDNADVTIFAQAPRLAPHLDQMRARLASALGANQSLINVKASSPEGIGALGRGDGMAAAAIVMLEEN
jgi:2-C-methyl-D-erythritol 2,4-cyclodiphosphate synthase